MSLPVLVVDDDPQVRSLVRAVLSKHGFLTLEAADGMSALSTVTNMDGAIGLMVSDFSMPGLDGETLAGLVKAQFPTTPILLMSSERTSCDSVAVDAFLAKPFLPSVLADAVRRLHKKQLHSEKKQCD
jgi:DNA-binding response OmpR family regulator